MSGFAGDKMVEIIEAKHIPTGAKASCVLVNSLEDLKKIAVGNHVGVILKDSKSFYVYTIPTIYRCDVKE